MGAGELARAKGKLFSNSFSIQRKMLRGIMQMRPKKGPVEWPLTNKRGML